MAFRPGIVTALPREVAVARLRAQVAALEPAGGDPVYQAPEALAPLLPSGGLKAGAAYCLTSSALLLSLLAGPSHDGLWCGLVGLPDVGAEAAQLAGVALGRLALVPDPGTHWLSVVATLADALPVVGIRPPAAVSPADASRLAARLRDHESVLLVLGPWPGSEATLSLGEPTWAGLGEGWGRLTSRTVSVAVTSKRYPSPKKARVLLPGTDGRLVAATPAEPAIADLPEETATQPWLRMVA